MRPAKGCNCEGSAKAGPERKEETSWASAGSKGVLWKAVPLDGREESEVFDDEDFRPVNLSQIDILAGVRETRKWLILFVRRKNED